MAKEAEIPLEYLNKPFYKEHTHHLAEFCDPWENIGYFLKLTKSNISAIKEDHSSSTEKQRIAMLQKWKEKFAHKATYRVLVEALIQSEHAEQALELCQKLKHEMQATSYLGDENKPVMHMSTDPSLVLKNEQVIANEVTRHGATRKCAGDSLLEAYSESDIKKATELPEEQKEFIGKRKRIDGMLDERF